MNMMTLLYVYLGGVALRAYLAHAAIISPLTKRWNLDAQMWGCILWPISMLLQVFRKRSE
jgi:hypothetical protein